MNFRFSLLFAFTTFLMSACSLTEVPLEEFNFNDGISTEIVVYGGVTSLDSSQVVILKTPGTWGGVEGNKPISDAEIVVSDGVKTYQYDESKDTEEKGVYYSKMPFKGEIGATYSIRIDWNDRVYTGQDRMKGFEAELPPLPITQVLSERGFIGLEMFRHSFGYDDPIKLKIGLLDSVTNTTLGLPILSFFTSRMYDFYLHDFFPMEGLYNSEVNIHPLWGRPHEKYVVYYMSMSDSYYDFVYEMLSESDWSAGILKSNPGNISTNLSSGARGYFFATYISADTVNMMDYSK
ncbi:DUF4249 domain-containing protein [Reichenbachiella ulvae]|uniref:DUF4249 domain-containing protein n=1 Tax=Reichenbachiella ulvae TaxID=2980104 RepID=A0ABT3CZ34_9BACT|nr:DUF4249 domain-containing protein [Reichenbachiella ulvae]MCV9388907.1 DUF4249 domain-containing protein [Reichenbachiella ulvae]